MSNSWKKEIIQIQKRETLKQNVALGKSLCINYVCLQVCFASVTGKDYHENILVEFQFHTLEVLILEIQVPATGLIILI